jgi:hypothetical protein
VTFGLTLAEAGVLSFRRVDAVAAMPVSFGSKGLAGPAADGQSTNASTRPAKNRRRVRGHHRGFRSPRGWPEESCAGRSVLFSAKRATSWPSINPAS